MNFPPGDPGSSGTNFPSSGPWIDPSTLLTIFVVIAIGLVAVVIIRAIARQAKMSDLRQNGKWVMATVNQIEQRIRTSVTGTPPNQFHHSHQYYVVIATWTDPDTGNRYIFPSDEFQSRPRYVVGDDVPVLVDRTNYHRYHMEI